MGVKGRRVGGAGHILCGARLWKSCCQVKGHVLETGQKIKKEDDGNTAAAAAGESFPSVSRTSRNSSTGAAAVMTQQWEVKPLSPHRLKDLCGLGLYVFLCLCSHVGAYNTLTSRR